MKFRTACQDSRAGESAVNCLSQGHNRMARVHFEPRLRLLQSNCSQPLDHCADNLISIPCTRTCFLAINKLAYSFFFFSKIS